MTTQLRLRDLIEGRAVVTTPRGSNTPAADLGLYLPQIGGDVDSWGDGTKGYNPALPYDAGNSKSIPGGLNDNMLLLSKAVLDKRVGGTISGPIVLKGTVTIDKNALLQVDSVVDNSATAFRIRDDANGKRMDFFFETDVDGDGDGSIDFVINYNNVGGARNIWIDGINGNLHMGKKLWADSGFEVVGNSVMGGDVTVSGTLTAQGPIVLAGSYIEFPNKEPSFLTGIANDGIMAFDSSRGIIIYRTQQVGDAIGDGTYTVLDSSNIKGGNGIDLANISPDINGTQAITFSVNSAYIQTIKVNDSDKVDGLHASQFVRSDADDTMTGNLTLNGTLTVTSHLAVTGRIISYSASNSASGIRIGNGADAASSAELFNMYFESAAANAQFIFNYSGSGAGDIQVASNGKVSIPSGSLDVTGGSYLKNGVNLDTIYAPFVAGFDGTPTWREPTRNLATTYTNTTGHIIAVSVACTVANNQNMRAVVNGTVVYMSGNDDRYTATFLVPNGATYRVENDDAAVGSGTNSGLTKIFWAEFD